MDSIQKVLEAYLLTMTGQPVEEIVRRKLNEARLNPSGVEDVKEINDLCEGALEAFQSIEKCNPGNIFVLVGALDYCIQTLDWCAGMPDLPEFEQARMVAAMETVDKIRNTVFNSARAERVISCKSQEQTSTSSLDVKVSSSMNS